MKTNSHLRPEQLISRPHNQPQDPLTLQVLEERLTPQGILVDSMKQLHSNHTFIKMAGNIATLSNYKWIKTQFEIFNIKELNK